MTDHNVPNPPGDTTTNSEDQASSGEKTIRVAVIGAPNAGKSSFINAITDHRVSNSSNIITKTKKPIENISHSLSDLSDITQSAHNTRLLPYHLQQRQVPDGSVRYTGHDNNQRKQEIQHRQRIFACMQSFDPKFGFDCCCARCVQFIHSKCVASHRIGNANRAQNRAKCADHE